MLSYEASITNIELLLEFEGLLVSLNYANMSCLLSEATPANFFYLTSSKLALACLLKPFGPVAADIKLAALSNLLRRKSESSAAFYF